MIVFPMKISKLTVSTILEIFQKQFEKAFCPRNEFANLQKNHTLESKKKSNRPYISVKNARFFKIY